MNKSKIDFIADIINSKKLDPYNKDRFFALALNEIKKLGDDDGIRQEIDDVKQKIEAIKYRAGEIGENGNSDQPRIFKAVFRGREQYVIADGETKNIFPFVNKNTGDLIIELSCIVFYDNGVVAKIVDESISNIGSDAIQKLEKGLTEKLNSELDNFKKENGATAVVLVGDYFDEENGLADYQNETNVAPPSPRQTDLPDYSDPKQLSQFLRAYNQDPILKYTCHEFDEDGLSAVNEKCEMKMFNLETFQKKLAVSFEKLYKEFDPPRYIRTLIHFYINGGKEWASDNVNINWKSPKLIEWSVINRGVAPNPGKDLIAKTENFGFEFNNQAFQSKWFGTRISTFSQLTIYFKCLFHVRQDNSLKRLIEYANTKKGWKEKINFDTCNVVENIEFFTDVDKLLQAYERIIRIVLDVADRQNQGIPVVTLSLKEVNGHIIFSIHHENSIYAKSMNNTLERVGQSHTNLIKNQINGMCDLYIQADFGGNDFARINLWNGEDRRAERLENFKGVEYQLVF